MPGGDIRLGQGLRPLGEFQLMQDGAAAAGAAGDDHLAAVPGQHPHRRLVDLRAQHLLRAAGEQRHPQPAIALRRDHLRLVDRRRYCDPSRRVGQHRPQLGRQHGRQRADEQAGEAGEAEQHRVRHDRRQQPAPQPVRARPGIGLLDVDARLVDEVRVVHAGRTRRHARQAGQAAIEMFDHRRRRRLAGFQHRLGEIDAAARTVEFVTEQQVGGTRGEAEAAVHAGAQDGVRLAETRRGKSSLSELGAHVQTSAYIRPGLSTRCGSKLSLIRRVSAASAGGWG